LVYASDPHKAASAGYSLQPNRATALQPNKVFPSAAQQEKQKSTTKEEVMPDYCFPNRERTEL